MEHSLVPRAGSLEGREGRSGSGLPSRYAWGSPGNSSWFEFKESKEGDVAIRSAEVTVLRN